MPALAGIMMMQSIQDPATLAALGQPYEVENMVRLAMTPKLDGVLEPEEWDRLSGASGSEGYMQWEPDTYYFAMRLPATSDAVLSLDANADGWLVGKDNVEVRVSMVNGEARVKVRTLDGTDPSGPQWVQGGISPEALKVAAQMNGGEWTVEVSFTPNVGRGPAVGTRVGARLDAVAANVDLAQAFLPRGMAFLILQFDSSLNLPHNFTWRPTFKSRSTARENRFDVRFDLNRDGNTFVPTSLEYRGEGLARAEIASGTQPFPTFDDRGRASFNYHTNISPAAIPGWRVIRATLKQANGEDVILRSSFRIADLVEFEVRLPESIPASTEAQIIRGSVILRSQYDGKVEGQFTCEIPESWTITRGKDEKFFIYHSRGSARVGLELIVPKNTVGLFPVKFTAKIGPETITKTVYIPVG